MNLRIFEWGQADTTNLPTAFVGVTVERTLTNDLHVGIIYRTPSNPPLVLDLRGHNYLRLDKPTEQQLCVLCPIEAFEVPALARKFRDIFKMNQTKIPFGFSSSSVDWFDSNSQFNRGTLGQGLCCHTFVLAAFSAAAAPLLIPTSPSCRNDDARLQQNHYDGMAQDIANLRSRNRDHFNALKEQIGAPMYRPLEVAGAAASNRLPCSHHYALHLSHLVLILLISRPFAWSSILYHIFNSYITNSQLQIIARIMSYAIFRTTVPLARIRAYRRSN